MLPSFTSKLSSFFVLPFAGRQPSHSTRRLLQAQRLKQIAFGDAAASPESLAPPALAALDFDALQVPYDAAEFAAVQESPLAALKLTLLSGKPRITRKEACNKMRTAKEQGQKAEVLFC